MSLGGTVEVGPTDRSDPDLSAFLRDAVTGMAFVGLDGRYRMVNEAFCRMIGRSEADLIGRRPAEITHPDDRRLSEQTIRQLFDSELTTDQIQKRYVRPDGSVLVAVRTTTVVRNQEGRPVGLFTQMVDVTDTATAQEAVARSEARFRALLEHAAELTLLLDREGRITFASPACLRLLGYAPEQMQGRSAFEFLHPDELDRAYAAFAGHMGGTGSLRRVVYRLRHRDGTWRHAEMVTANLIDDPSVGALVVNARDVTEQKSYEDQLLAREQRFRALVANSWDIITVHDAEGRIQYCSPAITAQLGYTPEEMIDADPFAIMHPGDGPIAGSFRQVVENNQNGSTIQYRFPHKDGSWRWLESVMHNRLDDPAVAGVVVTTRDVTGRRRKSAQQVSIAQLSDCALKEGRLQKVLQHVVDGVGQVLEVEHCGLVRDEGGGILRVVARHGPVLMGSTYQADRDGHPRTVTAQALRDGTTVMWRCCPGSTPPPVEGIRSGASAVVSPASGPRWALSIYSRRCDAFSEDDISYLESAANVLAAAITRHQIEGELRRQALYDNLTGLPNRVLLLDRLATALRRISRRSSRVAVLFVDLDNFKLVNDTLGHSAGDVVVAAVAERINAVVRSSDTVSRFGGDEFVVVSENVDVDEAAELARRIRCALSSPIELDARSVTVTVSIGYAVTTDPGVTPDDILAEADTAMYAAKQAGKDCAALFEPQMRQKVSAHLEAVSGMRRALEKDEFRLFYQPIFDVVAGSRIGCEGLIRWQHPTEGLLGPAEFIGYAEASGLVIPMGEWVLRTGCFQSAAWRAAGAPAHVSVNVSALQILESDMVEAVRRALADSGAHPSDLSLELTENAVMSDMDRAAVVIDQLRGLGVHVGLDDFGTGHSSLSQLAGLPFDFLKIDRSFVRDYDRDRRSAAMLETIATLSRTLELQAVAEGVETEDQLEHLKHLGVHLIQGYLLGRPVPAEDLPPG